MVYGPTNAECAHNEFFETPIEYVQIIGWRDMAAAW